MSRPNPPSPYRPIEDWSPEGRARLALEHEDEIRLLLDEAFSSFADEYPLSAFGFGGVEAAVDFAFDRFAHGQLDPARIRPASRSFRLFTEVAYWLSQKTGAGYRPIMARLRAGLERRTEPADRPAQAEPDDGLDEIREHTTRRWAATLTELGRRTCSDLVGYWLHATHRMRRDWFGWRDRGAIPSGGSKTAHSKHAHDALLRFQCLHKRLVPTREPRDPRTIATEASFFAGCANGPPYRADAATVAKHLPPGAASGPRVLNRLWRDGMTRLLHRLLDLLESDRDEDNPFETALGRASISLTTLHAFKLTERTLAQRITRISSDKMPPEEE